MKPPRATWPTRYRPGTIRELIARARIAGLAVYISGGRVVIDGPTAERAELVAALEANLDAVHDALLADVDRAIERLARSARGCAFWIEHGTPAQHEWALRLVERARRRALWAIAEASRDVLHRPPPSKRRRRLVGGRA